MLHQRLIQAAVKGDFATVSTMIDNEKDLDLSVRYNTVLYYALQKQEEALVQRLLERQEVKNKLSIGNHMLFHSLLGGYREWGAYTVIQYLEMIEKKEIVDNQILTACIKYGWFGLVKKILEFPEVQATAAMCNNEALYRAIPLLSRTGLHENAREIIDKLLSLTVVQETIQLRELVVAIGQHDITMAMQWMQKLTEKETEIVVKRIFFDYVEKLIQMPIAPCARKEIGSINYLVKQEVVQNIIAKQDSGLREKFSIGYTSINQFLNDLNVANIKKQTYDAQAIYEAAVKKDVQVIEEWVNQGGEIFRPDEKNKKVIDFVFQNDDVEALDFLVQYNATPKWLAIYLKIYLKIYLNEFPANECVFYVIKKYADEMELQDIADLLYRHSRTHFTEIATLFIERRPEILQEKRSEGFVYLQNICSCLSIAIRSGSIDLVEWLIEKKGVNIPEEDAQLSLIEMAVLEAENAAKMAEFLLEKGAVVRKDVFVSLALANVPIDDDMLIWLQEKGGDVNARSLDQDKTALLILIENVYLREAKKLIALGADRQVCDIEGNTVLMTLCHAIEEGDDENENDIVENCLEIGRLILDQLSPEVRHEFINQANHNGQTAIVRAVENGCDTMTALLLQYGAILPAHLQLEAMGETTVNGNQSTHELSVHYSLSLSVLALAGRYLPGLTEEERAILIQPLAGAFHDVQIEKHRKAAKALLKNIVARKEIEQYVKENIASIQKWIVAIDDRIPLFSQYNELKIISAKKAMKRILTDNYANFIDRRSGMPMRVGLVLVAEGLWDFEHNTMLSKSSCQERESIFLQAFYEMQRGYNLTENAEETNPKSKDSYICVPGHFNKMVSMLDARHPDVRIVVINKAIVTMRAYALLEKYYVEYVPVEVRCKHRMEVNEDSYWFLPKAAWDEYLSSPIKESLMKEYAPFVIANLFSAEKIERAAEKVIQMPLPMHVLKRMRLSLGEHTMEEKQSVIVRYGLWVKEDDKNIATMIKQAAVKRAGEYGVELGKKFNYYQYKVFCQNRAIHRVAFRKAQCKINKKTWLLSVWNEDYFSPSLGIQ